MGFEQLKYSSLPSAASQQQFPKKHKLIGTFRLQKSFKIPEQKSDLCVKTKIFDLLLSGKSTRDVLFLFGFYSTPIARIF